MTHSPCQRLVSTRVSTSGAPTTSTTQSSQEVETSPTTTISSLLNVRRHRSLYKSWKVSGSKIELEFCAAGSNTVPVYVWLLPVSSDNASLPTNPPTSTSILAQSASPSPRRWISDSAEDNKLSSYLRPRQHHLNDWNVNDYEYQGAYSSGPSEVDLLVHHRQTC